MNDLADRDYYASLTLTSPWGGCSGSTSATPAGPFESSERAALRPVAGDSAWMPDADGALDGGARDEGPPPEEEAESDEWLPDEWHELQLTPEEDLDAAAPSAPLAKASEARLPQRSEAMVVYVVSPKLARAVAKACLLAAGYGQLGATLEASASRARWSAALPDVRLRAARAIDETARVDYAGDIIGDTRLTGRADVRLEAALTWRLSELVFSGREPALARIQLTFLRQRQQIVRSALKLLFQWQRAQSLLTDPTRLPEEHVEAQLRSVEAEVQLAVLTGGWFSAERVTGAPWMVARVVDQPHEAPAELARTSAPRPAAARPRPKTQNARRPAQAVGAPQTSPGPIAPGESSAPGVNEPRDAF